jgi:hypothetical protein
MASAQWCYRTTQLGLCAVGSCGRFAPVRKSRGKAQPPRRKDRSPVWLVQGGGGEERLHTPEGRTRHPAEDLGFFFFNGAGF